MIEGPFNEGRSEDMSLRKLKEETELFYSYLRQNGLKKTYQKDLILETFLNTEGHLSVEDIYALVKKKDKKVGVVTVFRTLKSLTACGIAREITLGDGLTRFEHSYHHPITIISSVPNVTGRLNLCARNWRGFKTKSFKDITSSRFIIGSRHMEFARTAASIGPSVEVQKHDTERMFARDAIKMALSMETRCLDFYRDAAKRNQDPGGKEVFERMVREEETHIAELNGKLEEIVEQEKDLEHAPVFLHFDPCELESVVPDLAKFETERRVPAGCQNFCELAISLTADSTEFFKKYADKFAETQGKQILINFASQENAHGDLLRQRLEGLMTASNTV